ncbi:MAG: lipoprotein B transmembrane [Thiobacillus sp. 63-78]|uniref:LPS-assembly lipoprotein LptE n=1 Tax=Thiobacillus sp. 63-78 TaxID=1895859 RepID=UPI00095D3BEA|nr:LPS assembly lipoprotein LptE [Thiobacillus sp. 63-78]MBN8763505.1 lipoprotein B transmembrane [Thiobacillus sp.]MBN8773983.1 lipoprotein B transmembrane [Thiobacillus sp.]OJZ15847.1 MAG: lipoprotein B transmembrane [Thiobacillus sp. 63-78]
MNRRLFLAALPGLLAAGCGFQLRRSADIPFASLYVDAPAGSLVAQRIRKNLATNRKTHLAANAGEAEAVLKITREERTRDILSLSGAGTVTEYRLGLRLGYTLNDKAGRRLAASESIELTRDITYDVTKVLAKGAEEQLLYRDMEDNAAQRIMRRLQAIKPDAAVDEHPG